MNQIIFPVMLVSGIGLIAGLILAIASAIMAVPNDEITEKIKDVLPGANCGACGFSGCEGYAKALSSGSAKTGLCAPGGSKTAESISKILGVKSEKIEYKTALVKCSGTYDNTRNKMIYQGIESCKAAAKLYGGASSCSYGCLGLGDCVKSCKYGAITICNGVAIIDPKKCKGCSMCITSCPKGLIKFVPLKMQSVVRCSNRDKGAKTKKACDVGCIGCMRCTKVCEFDAIKVENHVAMINPYKCTGCGKCIEICPQECIQNFG